MTPELALYKELRADLYAMLEPVLQHPDIVKLGQHLIPRLAKMTRIPDVSQEQSDKILKAAQHLRRIEVRTNVDVQWMLEERERTMSEFTTDHRPMKIYAIYRADIEMTAPKLAAQTGHAYDGSHDDGKLFRPEITANYKGTGHGTKVVMYAKNFGQLMRAFHDAQDMGFPCEIVIDRGHVHPPHFDGRPIVTAIAIGPVYEDEVHQITKRYTVAKP